VRIHGIKWEDGQAYPAALEETMRQTYERGPGTTSGLSLAWPVAAGYDGPQETRRVRGSIVRVEPQHTTVRLICWKGCGPARPFSSFSLFLRPE